MLKSRMFTKWNNKENVLDREPYATFIKKFEKISGDLLNHKIHMRISSKETDEHDCVFKNGFYLDYVYTKSFDLNFEYVSIISDLRSNQQRFFILYTISFKFEGDILEDMMMYLMRDFKTRNGLFYLSSDVKECELDASVSNNNIVSLNFSVECSKEMAKEVSMQLISHTIALFCRSF